MLINLQKKIFYSKNIYIFKIPHTTSAALSSECDLQCIYIIYILQNMFLVFILSYAFFFFLNTFISFLIKQMFCLFLFFVYIYLSGNICWFVRRKNILHYICIHFFLSFLSSIYILRLALYIFVNCIFTYTCNV